MPSAKDYVTTKDAVVPAPKGPPPGVERTLTPLGEWTKKATEPGSTDPDKYSGFVDALKATIHQKTAPEPTRVAPPPGYTGPRVETNYDAFATVMKGTLTPSMVTLLRGRLDQYDRNVQAHEQNRRTDGDPKP